MNQVNRPLKLAIAGAVAALTGAVQSASAQTVIDTMPAAATAAPAVATAPDAGNLTTAVATPKVPTSATPQMIKEAVQRSKARAAKALLGVPEQFGSEEPFTFNPNLN